MRHTTEVGRRNLVRRMSPYERRRGGNALRQGARRLAGVGNADAGQRGSGHLAVPGLGQTSSWTPQALKVNESDKQTSCGRGVYVSAFKPPCSWKGRSRTCQGQNRTREIRPSGIVGGPMETWVMGVGLRPRGKPRELPPNPNAVMRHRSIPTLLAVPAPTPCSQAPVPRRTRPTSRPCHAI